MPWHVVPGVATRGHCGQYYVPKNQSANSNTTVNESLASQEAKTTLVRLEGMRNYTPVHTGAFQAEDAWTGPSPQPAPTLKSTTLASGLPLQTEPGEPPRDPQRAGYRRGPPEPRGLLPWP